MIQTANNVAIGTTPKFSLVLQDGESLYYPSYVLYTVQGLKSDMTWVDVSKVKKLVPDSSEISIILSSDDTRYIEDLQLQRRLIVQVFYTDHGQTLSSIQEIDFMLQDLPVLDSEYTPDVPETETLHVEEGRSLGACDGFSFIISFTDPVDSILSVEAGILNPFTQEVVYEEATGHLLSGNSSVLIFYDNPDLHSGEEIFFRIKALTQVKKEAVTLEASVVN